MLVSWNGKSRVYQEEEAGQGRKRADPKGEESACTGRVRGVEESTAEGGDEGMRWISDGSNVSEARRENLLLVREQNRRDVRSVGKILSARGFFANGT